MTHLPSNGDAVIGFVRFEAEAKQSVVVVAVAVWLPATGSCPGTRLDGFRHPRDFQLVE